MKVVYQDLQLVSTLGGGRASTDGGGGIPFGIVGGDWKSGCPKNVASTLGG